MAGLTMLVMLLGCIAAALGVHCFLIHRRLRQLTEALEGFLSCHEKPLSFSVREDSAAYLHNAIVELQNHLLLSQEQYARECRRTSRLIADISHQFKTPLASLRLFCELDAGVHLSQQLSQLERMDKLIYALLRLERLCADGYSFDFQPHDVRAIIEEAFLPLSPLWPERTLTITGDACIRCDAKWMGEALMNLLKNACEHTAPGGTITASMECSESTFFCTLEDDGGGVAPDELPHLFERFYRSKHAGPEGAGIGLAIVQAIILRHHGSICAENGVKGLRIRFCLPILNRV